MKYRQVVPAEFIQRPNRFIAHVRYEGRTVVCHVKNTGRCRELLIPGAVVYLQKAENPKRKTAYDLIAVKKGARLVNIDSQAPNAVFSEWVKDGHLGHGVSLRPEYRYGESRMDFLLERAGSRCLAEVKGVTLEKDGVALFPDAPTERGVRHLRELIKAAGEGYDALMVFVIQMSDVDYFTPNDQTHAAFGKTLRAAEAAGVKIIALDCHVTPERISARRPVALRL